MRPTNDRSAYIIIVKTLIFVSIIIANKNTILYLSKLRRSLNYTYSLFGFTNPTSQNTQTHNNGLIHITPIYKHTYVRTHARTHTHTHTHVCVCVCVCVCVYVRVYIHAKEQTSEKFISKLFECSNYSLNEKVNMFTP